MANNIPPAHEMLQTDKAIIVGIKDMASKIAELIKNKNKYDSMKHQRYDFTKSNMAIMGDFYALME